MKIGGVVLCGGKSRRMGTSKADLPFGPETMLNRVLRLLGQAVDHLAVVAAEDRPLPLVDHPALVVRDRRPDRGPLEGLAVGLRALQNHVDVVYVTSCDVPLLQPQFVTRLTALLEGDDVAVPVDGGFHHPLSAVYRPRVLGPIDSLLAAGRLQLTLLYDEVKTRRIPVDQLRDADPELQTLTNLNSPEDYRRAILAAGFEIPPEVDQLFSSTA